MIKLIQSITKSERSSFEGVLFISISIIIISICGCTQSSTFDSDHSSIVPINIGPEVCGACGMVVREQPAPRAQAVHRDGTRVYFCSIGDMIQYIVTPSPHGKVKRTFVEVLSPDVQLSSHDTHPHEWYDARQAHYVLGVKRSGIMGPPVFIFASSDEAEYASKHLDGQIYSWSNLTNAVLLAAEHPNTH